MLILLKLRKLGLSVGLIAADWVAGWVLRLKIGQSVSLGIKLLQLARQILTHPIEVFCKLR